MTKEELAHVPPRIRHKPYVKLGDGTLVRNGWNPPPGADVVRPDPPPAPPPTEKE